MIKSKTSALLSLLLVFLSGCVLGAFSYRLYMVNTVASAPGNPPRRPSPEEWRKHYLADLQKHANLTDQQLDKVNGILDEIGTETKKEMTSIHDEQIRRINAILNPDQQAL